MLPMNTKEVELLSVVLWTSFFFYGLAISNALMSD
jgi:hypothetical protein